VFFVSTQVYRGTKKRTKTVSLLVSCSRHKRTSSPTQSYRKSGASHKCSNRFYFHSLPASLMVSGQSVILSRLGSGNRSQVEPTSCLHSRSFTSRLTNLPTCSHPVRWTAAVSISKLQTGQILYVATSRGHSEPWNDSTTYDNGREPSRSRPMIFVYPM
jgi:hypothetical protein